MRFLLHDLIVSLNGALIFRRKAFLVFDFGSSILKNLRLTMRARAAALEVSARSAETESSDLQQPGSMKEQLFCKPQTKQ